MQDRDAPYGSYSEAIPMEKLIRLTRSKLSAHPDYTDEHVREYAEQVVEEELDPRTLSSENIVDALVEEILRKSDE